MPVEELEALAKVAADLLEKGATKVTIRVGDTTIEVTRDTILRKMAGRAKDLREIIRLFLLGSGNG